MPAVAAFPEAAAEDEARAYVATLHAATGRRNHHRAVRQRGAHRYGTRVQRDGPVT